MKDKAKTKNELAQELVELRRQISELVSADVERKHVEEMLQERVRELTCLYRVNHDMQKALSADELCKRIIQYLVPAMQFPELTVPVIELDGTRYTSERHTDGLSGGIHAEIREDEKVLGHLRVYYTEDKPFLLPEEQNLLNAIGGGSWSVDCEPSGGKRDSQS